LDNDQNIQPSLTIAAVEREVGLSKDVLRVWERRYGFPTPHRDPHGERRYSPDQVRRLGLIKRLMDRGHRPGALLRMPESALLALSTPPAVAAAGPDPNQLDKILAHLHGPDERALAEALQQRLAHVGLQVFVLDTVAPLAMRVGQDWAAGQLQIHEEHLFTEVVTRVMRQAISQLPRGKGPMVLLTTLPSEHHALGLLMVEALLALHGARCVNLGTQMPMLELVRAAEAHAADAVAMSFSKAFGAPSALRMTQQLRSALQPEVQLWVGGAGATKLAGIPGVHLVQALDALPSLLARQVPPDAVGTIAGATE
jgi:methanogenic corrinoid protein MtbC1